MIFLVGVLLSILSGGLYFGRNAVSKKITNSGIKPVELTGIQNISGVVVFLILILISGSNPFGRLSSNDIPAFLALMLIIGILAYIAGKLQYEAVKSLPLSTTVLAYDIVPIVTTIFAVIIINEGISWYDLLGIIVTTLGILLIDFEKFSKKQYKSFSLKKIFKNKSNKIVFVSIVAFSLMAVLQKKALLMSGEVLPVFFFMYLTVALIASGSIYGLKDKIPTLKAKQKNLIIFVVVALLAFATGIIALQYIPVGISSAMKGFITPFLVLTATLKYKEGNLAKKLLASGVIGGGIIVMSLT
ncbi:DMT family transporter [Candidatus Dojkabacteria bacterium]|uniref:DMT family transporter n=1 Tax=Candidatus Dojkabacteria bacterium TaxID=2099670 RepID=A0A955L3F4_9BACT|nr:DMT family transporter [Candidatus Dojkabacteria bacterium]